MKNLAQITGKLLGTIGAFWLAASLTVLMLTVPTKAVIYAVVWMWNIF